MTTLSLVTAVAPRTVKFLKGEKICYKMVYYTLCIGSANRQKSCWKVEFT